MSLSRNIVNAILDIAPQIITFIIFFEQKLTFSNNDMSLTSTKERCPSGCTIKRQHDASNIGDMIPFQSVIAIVSMPSFLCNFCAQLEKRRFDGNLTDFGLP
jgi:hypothetical protein